VKAYTPAVVRIARLQHKRYGRHDEVQDFVQAGIAGILRALDTHTKEHASGFGTYAIGWALTSIHEYAIQNSSALSVKLASAYQRTLKNISKAREKLGDAATDAEIAAVLGVAESDLRSALNAQNETSASEMVAADGDTTVCDEIPSEDESAEDAVYAEDQRRLVQEALGTLTERQRHIVIRHDFREEPFSVIAAALGGTKQGVAQLHQAAMKKLLKFGATATTRFSSVV